MINKIKSISVSIATCSYLVTESVCVCVCGEHLGSTLLAIHVCDAVLLTTNTMIVLIWKILRTYSSDE